MGWRSKLEDKYTVRCKFCGHEVVDPNKKPRQKYIIGECPICRRIHKPR
jgi:predicted restriction endonuclease